MSDSTSSNYCDQCQRITLHTKGTPNHILHLLLTIVTGGLWGIVWIALAVRASSKKRHCTVCGHVPGRPVASPIHPVPAIFGEDRDESLFRDRPREWGNR